MTNKAGLSFLPWSTMEMRGRSEFPRTKTWLLVPSRLCHFLHLVVSLLSTLKVILTLFMHCLESSSDSRQYWRERLCKSPQKSVADNISQKGDKMLRAGWKIIHPKFPHITTVVWSLTPGQRASPTSGRPVTPSMFLKVAESVTWLGTLGVGAAGWG